MRTIALALGAGGARGLAHIPVLEAFDELGVRPTAIAGASVGALIGAGYGAGMSGRDLRAYVTAILRDRGEVMRRLFTSRVGRVTDLLSVGHPMLADAERLVDSFLPSRLPKDFAGLFVPLTVVATDFWERAEAAFSSGALRPALAGSIAVPGLLRPVPHRGHVLIDGGIMNPLPFDLLHNAADLVVAVDVSGGPARRARGIPAPFQAMFSTVSIMAHAIVTEKLKGGAPDLLLQPKVNEFHMLDFFRSGAILRAAEPIKEETKRRLGALLGSD